MIKRLEKKLKELQQQGFETVTIQQILQWISDYWHDAFVKRHHLDD